MKKLVIALILLASTAVAAEMSPSSFPLLQQDMIGYQNYYPEKTHMFVVGRTSGVNNVRVDLWEGPVTTYSFPTTSTQMAVISSSASDSLGSTGTEKIHFHYLDKNYIEHEEILTTKGTTTVLTSATDILRVNGVHAVQSGSGGVSAGDISMKSLDGATTYAIIKAGYNTARQAIFTVPSGKTFYVSHWQYGSGSANNHFCQIDVRATAHMGEAWASFLLADTAGSQNGGGSVNFPIPIKLPARTDVKISATCDASNANAAAIGSVMGWYE